MGKRDNSNKINSPQINSAPTAPTTSLHKNVAILVLCFAIGIVIIPKIYIYISSNNLKKIIVPPTSTIVHVNDKCTMRDLADANVKYLPKERIECDSALHLVTSAGSNFPQYHLNESAFELLTDYYKGSSVYFLPLIGDGMSGKSTLTNQILNGLTGNHGLTYFPVGSRNVPTTLGLWASRCRIPFRGGNLVLLDTEGLRDRFYSFLIPAITPLIASHILYLNPGRVAQGGLIDNLDIEKSIVSFREEIVKLDKENFEITPGKTIVISRILEDFKKTFADDFNLKHDNFEFLFQMAARDSDKKNFLDENSLPFSINENSTCYARSSAEIMNYLFANGSTRWKKHATTHIIRTVLADYITVYNSILHEAFDKRVSRMEQFKHIVHESLQNYAISLYQQKIRSLFSQIENSCDFKEMENAFTKAIFFVHVKKDRHQKESELMLFTKTLVYDNVKSCIDKTFGSVDFCDRSSITSKQSAMIDMIIQSGDLHQRNTDLSEHLARFTKESLCDCLMIAEYASDHVTQSFLCNCVRSYSYVIFIAFLFFLVALLVIIFTGYGTTYTIVPCSVLLIICLIWNILYFSLNNPFYFPDLIK